MLMPSEHLVTLAIAHHHNCVENESVVICYFPCSRVTTMIILFQVSILAVYLCRNTVPLSETKREGSEHELDKLRNDEGQRVRGPEKGDRGVGGAWWQWLGAAHQSRVWWREITDCIARGDFSLPKRCVCVSVC